MRRLANRTIDLIRRSLEDADFVCVCTGVPGSFERPWREVSTWATRRRRGVAELPRWVTTWDTGDDERLEGLRFHAFEPGVRPGAPNAIATGVLAQSVGRG